MDGALKPAAASPRPNRISIRRTMSLLAATATAALALAGTPAAAHSPSDSLDMSSVPPRLRLLSRQDFTPTAPEDITKPWDGPMRDLNYRGYKFLVPVTPPRNPNTTDGVSCSWQGCDDNYYLYGCWDYPKKAVISFDDGPSQYTSELLDILKEQKMTAVFCYLGMQMEKYPEVVRRTLAEGHELCIHSWNHGHMTEMTDEAIVDQLVETQETIRRITGQTAFWFRPPFGELDVRVKAIAEQLKFKFLFWYSDTEDWRWAFSNVTEQVAGSLRTYSRDLRSANRTSPIFLAHDMHRGSNLVMPQVAALARNSGYEIVTGVECTKKAPVFWGGLDWSWTPPTGPVTEINLYQGRYDGVGGHTGKNIPPKDWVPRVFPAFAKQFENVTSIQLGGKPGLVAGAENQTEVVVSTKSETGTGTLVVVTATKLTAATGAATTTTMVAATTLAVPVASSSVAAVVTSTTTSRPSGAVKGRVAEFGFLLAIFLAIAQFTLLL